MVLITIVTGAYKPTYNWGAPHCMLVYQRVYVLAAPVMAMFELTSHVCALNRRKFWSLGANLPRTMRIKACACSLSFAENEVLPTPMIYDNFPTKFIIWGLSMPQSLLNKPTWNPNMLVLPRICG